MRINKIKLNNIRSYVDQEIVFPANSLLLSGDIGSGKSTILLSIEFSLFGSQRGILTGSSLLRNGAKSGYVELDFDVDSKNIIIKRTLKKESNIVQDSGFVVIDGVKKEAGPMELRQIILDLLNYPQEFLTKSKSLIYRYTVYTPQEEMKQILLGSGELRADILRRVFGVEKYKVIRENSKILASRLKEKKKELSGMVSDLESKLSDKRISEGALSELSKESIRLVSESDELKVRIDSKKESLKKIADRIDMLREVKKEIELNSIKLENNLNRERDINLEVQDIEKQIRTLEKELAVKLGLGDVLKMIAEKEAELKVVENEISEINNKLSEYKVMEDNSRKIKSSLISLEICPLCRQKVSREHKHSIFDAEDKKTGEYASNLSLYKEKLIESRGKYDHYKKELAELSERKSLIEVNKIKKRSVNDKSDNRKKLLESLTKIKEEIKKLSQSKELMESKLAEFEGVEERYREEERTLSQLLEKEKILGLDTAAIKAKIEGIKGIIENLAQEIGKKLKIKEHIDYLENINNLIDQNLVLILENIEKQVMMKIYFDFNSFFRKWFSLLMKEENLDVKLDEEFTPVIEQNGYNVDYVHLSGGEKTAIALAYRLSLNQVINNLVTAIKTSDLLILDEPTDGFSDEQLDRIRLVLEELKINQVIIVSHEPKIESFVENVIRLKKEDHISRVV